MRPIQLCTSLFGNKCLRTLEKQTEIIAIYHKLNVQTIQNVQKLTELINFQDRKTKTGQQHNQLIPCALMQ